MKALLCSGGPFPGRRWSRGPNSKSSSFNFILFIVDLYRCVCFCASEALCSTTGFLKCSLSGYTRACRRCKGGEKTKEGEQSINRIAWMLSSTTRSAGHKLPYALRVQNVAESDPSSLRCFSLARVGHLSLIHHVFTHTAPPSFTFPVLNDFSLSFRESQTESWAEDLHGTDQTNKTWNHF